MIPVYNGAQFLDECLCSVLEQDHQQVDVVVVDDGSTDDSLAIARRHARADRRVTVLSQSNAGVGVARKTGTAAAKGTYITFVDADDSVTRTGIRSAMDSLMQTGSDLAVMPYQRRDESTVSPPRPWIGALHSRPVQSTTLVERPDVLVHAAAHSKIFQRRFWDSVGLEFPTVLLAGDQVVSAKALINARSIDIAGIVAYSWRLQLSSISQGHVTAASVHAWIDAAEAVLRVLEPLPQVRGERALQLVSTTILDNLRKLERADDAYLDAMIERVPSIVEAVLPDRYAAQVPAQYRVLYALLANGVPDAVRRFVQAEGMQPQMHPAGFEPSGFTAYLPGWQQDDVSPEAYVLTAEQTRLKLKVRAATVSGADLVVDLAAWFLNVELTDLEPVLTVEVPDAMAEVVHEGEPALVTSRRGAQRRYLGSGWTVTLVGAAESSPKRMSVSLQAGAFTGKGSVRLPRDERHRPPSVGRHPCR